MPLRQGCLFLIGCLAAATWPSPGSKPVRAGGPEAPVRTDLHGDPLPAGARARLGTIRFQTAGFPVALAVSPDGRTIACLGQHGTITLLDTATGKRIRHFSGGPPAGTWLIFSPDGRRLASCAEGGIDVWEVRTGRRATQLRSSKRVVSLAFARDGQSLIGAAEDGKVRQWDLATGKELRRFAIHTRDSDSLANSQDGRLLAHVSTDGFLRLWDLATGRQLRVPIFVGRVQIQRVDFSPDGKFLACNEFQSPNHYVCLRDVASGKEISRVGAFKKHLALVVFSPSGKLIATSEHESCDIELWEVATGKQVRSPWQWQQRFGCAAFTPDGKTLVAAWGATIRLWDITTGRRIPRVGGHTSEVSSLAFSPDGKLLASSSEGDDDREARLWDVRTTRELPLFGDRRGGTHVVAFSPDGKRFASARGSMISLWEVASRKRLRTFGERKNLDTPLAFTQDGKAVVAGYGGELRHWDVETGNPSGKVEAGSLSRQTAFSADGKYLASFISLGGHIDVTDRSTGKTLPRIIPTQFPPGVMGETVIALSTTRPLLASANGKGLHLWDVTSGKHLRWTALPENWDAYCLAFSPDGRTLALAGGGGIIRLLEVTTGKERCVYQAHESSIWSLAFSPDGRLLASGSWDTTILLWDLARLPPRNKR